MTGIEGVEISDEGYVFQTEQSVKEDLWIKNQPLLADGKFENLAADVSRLRIPVVQFSNVPTENIMNIMECVIQDNPEFCFPSSYSIIKSNDGTPLYISGYYQKAATIIEDINTCKEQAVSAVAIKIESEMGRKIDPSTAKTLPVADKVKIVKAIHDYIVETGNPGSVSCTKGRPAPYIWQSTMYSVFDAKQQGLCEGYAQAFNYLVRLYGIESITMTGEGFHRSSLPATSRDSELTAGGHAWNAVYFYDVNDAVKYEDASNWSPIDVFWDEPLHENSIMKTAYNEEEIKVLRFLKSLPRST